AEAHQLEEAIVVLEDPPVDVEDHHPLDRLLDDPLPAALRAVELEDEVAVVLDPLDHRQPAAALGGAEAGAGQVIAAADAEAEEHVDRLAAGEAAVELAGAPAIAEREEVVEGGAVDRLAGEDRPERRRGGDHAEARVELEDADRQAGVD